MQTLKLVYPAILVALLLCIAPLKAQKPGRQGPPMLPDSSKVTQLVDEVAEKAGLDEAQKEQLLVLHFDHIESLRGLLERHQANRNAMRDAHQELRDEMDRQIRALMTDEQLKEYEQYMAVHRPRQHQQGVMQGRGGARGGRRPGK